ncbi:MAG TPA: hypothetical protein VIU38_08400 [Anaerolineales bacterium]
MKESRIKSALEAIARRQVPENTDIWPRIQSRLPKGTSFMRLQTKMSWSLLWVLLALALLTTAAYALYRYFNDPGLQAAEEAGLITDVNATAEASLATAQPPYASGDGKATIVGTQQIVSGVTVKLDWVYVEDARQAFHISAEGLRPGMRFGIPVMSYSDVQPTDFSGATFRLEGSDKLSGTYLAHQLVRPEQGLGGSVPVQIDIPLLAWNDGHPANIGAFHFDVDEVEITVPWGGGGSDSYRVEVNGIQMVMEHAILAPDHTQVRLCYEPPEGGDWLIDGATLQYGDPITNELGPAVKMDAAIEIHEEGHQPCEDVNFPRGGPDREASMVLMANGLVLRDGSQKLDSTWQFNRYVQVNLHIGGIASAQAPDGPPIESQTVGDITATLEWMYIDSNRIAFTVHFSEWRDGFALTNIALRTPDGKDINAGMNWGPSESDPATTLISMTPANPLSMERFTGQLLLSVITSLSAGAPTNEFTFDLDLPVYQAVTIESGQSQTANGTQLLLQRVKVAPSWTVAYVCYEKPTTGDWGIGQGTTLQIGSDRAEVADYMMMYDSDYANGGKGLEPGWIPPIAQGRCIRLGFPVGSQGASETLTLRIESLQLSTPEVIPEVEVQRAREVLKSQGIEMDWMTVTGSGGGGGGPVYKRLPDGMTEMQAYERFLDALGHIHKGPWVFTLKIDP